MPLTKQPARKTHGAIGSVEVDTIAAPAKGKVKRRSVKDGSNRVIRTGGGVRVAVFGVDAQAPEEAVRKIVKLRKDRRKYPILFDRD